MAPVLDYSVGAVLGRAMTRVDVNPCWVNGCWHWLGGMDGDGYATIKLKPRASGGSRAAPFFYRALVGPIAEGLVIDHLCRNHACVNPEHLEPVTQRENVLRGFVTGQTHCPHGHEYTDSNTIWSRQSPGRMPSKKCRTCRNARSACYGKSHPAKRGAPIDCQYCGRSFAPLVRSPDAKYCSQSCSGKSRTRR